MFLAILLKQSLLLEYESGVTEGTALYARARKLCLTTCVGRAESAVQWALERQPSGQGTIAHGRGERYTEPTKSKFVLVKDQSVHANGARCDDVYTASLCLFLFCSCYCGVT